jgi:hypothetical protein
MWALRLQGPDLRRDRCSPVGARGFKDQMPYPKSGGSDMAPASPERSSRLVRPWATLCASPRTCTAKPKLTTCVDQYTRTAGGIGWSVAK